MKIFFDVDGVLIDGWHADPALRKPWDLTIEQDLGVDRAAFENLMFGLPAGRDAPLISECVRGRLPLEDALASVLPQVGYRGAVEDFIAYWFERDSNRNAAVFALVEQLAAHPQIELYVATAQEHRRARHLWDELGFSRLFAEIFYSARLGCLKKSPRFFEAINEELSIGADESPLFFDDQPAIVALAREAGWDAVHFTDAGDIRSHPRLLHCF